MEAFEKTANFRERFIDELVTLDRMELLKKVREKLDETMTQDTAMEILERASKSLDGFEDKTRDWTVTDRLLWFVKESYIGGYLFATDVMVQLFKAELE